MFTGPVGPVEVFFYWPEADFGNFYWPGAIGSPLASSPVRVNKIEIRRILLKSGELTDLYESWMNKKNGYVARNQLL